MRDRLKKIYFILLAPAIAGFFAAYAIRCIQQPAFIPAQLMAVIAPAIFILTAVFAVAGPILFRSFFAHLQRNHSRVSQKELFKFERRLIGISMVAPYLALVAYHLQLPRFHLAATFLMALYAIYYYYPSQKRIMFDGNMFRAGNVMSVERMR